MRDLAKDLVIIKGRMTFNNYMPDGTEVRQVAMEAITRAIEAEVRLEVSEKEYNDLKGIYWYRHVESIEIITRNMKDIKKLQGENKKLRELIETVLPKIINDKGIPYPEYDGTTSYIPSSEKLKDIARLAFGEYQIWKEDN